MTETSSESPHRAHKMPAGIPYILTNEAAERFSFYGMRCILTIFMTKYIVDRSGMPAVLSEEDAKAVFHLFVGAVYYTPLLGALLADIWLGKYKTILWCSLVSCLGFFILALDQTRLGLGLGLSCIAVGSGMIKPCVSANVGDQFNRRNQHLIEKVYGWFYFSINFGAFISNLIVPELLDRLGPRIAFGLPAMAMLMATVAFWLGGKHFTHIPPAAQERRKAVDQPSGVRVIGRPFTWVKTIIQDVKAYVLHACGMDGLRVLLKLAVLYAFIAVFWSIWEQMDSAWVLQAEKLDRIVFGYEIKSSQLVALNPLLIMILIPCFSYVIYPLINTFFPLNPLRKISIGLFVTTLPFVVSAGIETQIQGGERPTVLWMILGYILITAAEVMVSITALEFSYTQAPRKMKSFVMAAFFFSITLGNLFTAAVNVFIQNPDGSSKLEGPAYYWFFTLVMLVTAVLFIPAARCYKMNYYIQDETES